MACDEPTDPPQYRTPECEEEDCTAADVWVLEESGQALRYTVRWSDAAGTLSVMLDCYAVTESTWSLDGTEIVELHDERIEPRVQAECGTGGNMLRTNGYLEWERSEGALADMFREMNDRTSCIGLAYPP